MALNNTYDARPVQQETAVGAGAQILLLALLGTATGMGPAGWLAGLVFAFATWAVLSRALHRSGLRRFGPANRVTLGRATLVGGVTALVADSFMSSPPVSLLVGLTAVALLLDGVDGKVARRTDTCTPLGARFDMEVDAFLILVLSVHVSTALGPWVLLIGGMRYAFVAAARVLPWLNASLPPSTARKTVAALQGICLLLAGSGLLPQAAALGVVLSALGLLVWSFGRDVLWLWRASRVAQAVTGDVAATEPAAAEAGSARTVPVGGTGSAAPAAAVQDALPRTAPVRQETPARRVCLPGQRAGRKAVRAEGPLLQQAAAVEEAVLGEAVLEAARAA